MKTIVTVDYMVGTSVEREVIESDDKIITQVIPGGIGRVITRDGRAFAYADVIKIVRVES